MHHDNLHNIHTTIHRLLIHITKDMTLNIDRRPPSQNVHNICLKSPIMLKLHLGNFTVQLIVNI